MSNSVEIDASNGVDQGVEKNTSDIVLGVFWTYAVKPEISFREFKELVETWLKIREMEAERAGGASPSPTETTVHDPDYRKLYYDLVDSLLTPEEPEEPEEEVQIDQRTYVSKSDAEAEIEALKAGPGKYPDAPHPPAEPAPSPQGEGSEESKPGSWAKAKADREFKQTVYGRLKQARKMGIGSETIAQNAKGQGVTGDTIRQILNAQPVDVRKYRKIDEALDRLGVPKEENHEQED